MECGGGGLVWVEEFEEKGVAENQRSNTGNVYDFICFPLGVNVPILFVCYLFISVEYQMT